MSTPSRLSPVSYEAYSEGTNKAVRRGWNPTPDLAATSRMGDALASIQATAPDPTSVYRYYDYRNALIYVGITRQGMGRNLQHNGGAEWWQYVDHQTVEHYPSREEAAAREKYLIQKYHPPFNRQHNIQWRQIRELYLAVASVPDRRETLLEAYQRVGKKLPLDIHAYLPEQRRLVLRTRLEDFVIASALRAKDGVFLEGRGRMARLLSIETTGSFALLNFSVKMPREIESVAASIRFRQSTTLYREHIEIRNLTAETAPLSDEAV